MVSSLYYWIIESLGSWITVTAWGFHFGIKLFLGIPVINWKSNIKVNLFWVFNCICLFKRMNLSFQESDIVFSRKQLIISSRKKRCCLFKKAILSFQKEMSFQESNFFFSRKQFKKACYLFKKTILSFQESEVGFSRERFCLSKSDGQVIKVWLYHPQYRIYSY